MEAINFVRKIDDLGRIVLPIEIRQALELESGGTIRILFNREQQKVTLEKAQPNCICCNNEENLKALPHGKYICQSCLNRIS